MAANVFIANAMHLLLLLALVSMHRFVPTAVALIAVAPAEPKSCATERYHKLLGLVCSNLNLREVPQNLNTDVEVIECVMS